MKAVKSIIIGSILGFSMMASAAQYEVEVTGNFEKNPTVAESFGVTSSSQPVSLKIVLDDTLPGIIELPAGSDISGTGVSFSQDLTFVDASAIVSLTLTIGDTSWSKADLVQSAPLGTTAIPYHLLLEGNLDTGISQAKLRVDNAGGLLEIGQFNCPSSCNISGTAFSFDYSNNTDGILSNVSASVSLIEEEPEEEATIEDLVDDLRETIANLGLHAGVVKAIMAKITKRGGDKVIKARLVVLKIFVLVLRGKKIPTDKANAIINAIDAILLKLKHC